MRIQTQIALPALMIGALLAAGCGKTSTEQAATPEAGGAAAPGAPAPAGAPAAGGAPVAAEAPARAKGVARPPAGQAARSEAPRAAEPPRVRVAKFEAGTPLRIRTTSTLSTKDAQSGERFVATLVDPLVEGGWVVAPKGSQVEGRVVEADKGGRVKGVAQIAVQLVSLTTTDGRTVPLVTNTIAREAHATKKKDAAKVGIGAGIGAAIGAIAGGGKGAAIGAAAGGGAGGAAVLATRGDPAVIPAESVLTFKLASPVQISEKR